MEPERSIRDKEAASGLSKQESRQRSSSRFLLTKSSGK
jgi:hypothetical protein